MNGVEGGIRNIEAEGALRVVIKPNLQQSKVPVISLIQIYFLRDPMTNFELTSALATLDMFSTGNLIRLILKDQISKHLVFPNKIDIKLDPDAENSIFNMPDIDGVVKVNIMSLEEIEIEDGTRVSVKISLGDEIEETKIVKITENAAKVDSDFHVVSYKNGDKELKISVISHDDEIQITELGR